MGTEDTRKDADQQAYAQLDSIKEMVAALAKAEREPAYEDAERAIHEDALSVEVRSGWYAPGDKPGAPEEFTILLCTGGPAVRIRGSLEHGEPTGKIELESQGWFIPWAPVKLSQEDRETLARYASCFYFGE